ncbi:MAG: Kazal-type serine protease inhibitor domain-containing protein [Pseudomonadota bacterium]
MSNSNQSANQTQNRPWPAFWPVLLFAPLAMAPKGCNSVVVGDECPDPSSCTSGIAGGSSGASAGTAGITNGHSYYPQPGGDAGSFSGDSVCGGLLGSSCAENEFCAYDETAACGAADQTGICVPKPSVCNDISDPVCGCDGQTYANQCEAAAKGSSVQHAGACEAPSSGESCGGLKPASCAKSEYCNYPVETKCGSGDQTGTCTKIPDACDTVYDPVCGCDNLSYSNACTAAGKGISVLHSGACDGSTSPTVCGGLQGGGCPKDANCIYPVEAQCGANDQTGTCASLSDGPCPQIVDPVCGCDGKTYSNTCVANSMGVSVAASGACNATCGGELGVECTGNQYCNYPISANCGRADATGTCVLKSYQNAGGCLTNYDPVCGCDGMTYGNACQAGRAAVSIAATGECP